MCFSAHASFAAAAALTGIGVVSLQSTKSRAQLPFAAIPLLFAAQQASEGALWLVLNDAPWGKSDVLIGRVFLFFALLVWPSYVPIALLPLETHRARRRLLAVLAVIGTALGLYLFGCATLRPSDACIAFDNIYYGVRIDSVFRRASPFVYVATVAAPLVVSSVRGTSLLAGLAVSSAAFTAALYRAGFVSVWCFFAAVLSGVVAVVVRFDAHAIRKRTPVASDT